MLFFCSQPPVAEAWRTAVREQKQDPQVTPSQIQAAAKKLALSLHSDPFVQKPDLPLKVVLAEVMVKAPLSGGLTSEDVTDVFLNLILDFNRLLILNEDPQFKDTTSVEYKLGNYLSVMEARRKGLALGADYVVIGKIEKVFMTTDDGGLKNTLTGFLEIREIRSNALKVHVDLETSARSKRLHRP